MLTADQILALAPDVASAKAGNAQANSALWSQLGANNDAVWGLCQGSGKEPYRTQIELATPAFKCSCPSRKFPCKHGLGLFLLYAKQTNAFQHPQPDWVAEWLQGREQRADKKANKAEEQKSLSTDDIASREKSAQKRQDKRVSNVIQGVDLLSQWLEDLAKEGIGSLRTQATGQWDAMAARMIDAQAPGLASKIRHAASRIYNSTQANWEIEVARELGLLCLLTQAFRQARNHPELFSPLQHSDLRTAIGWTISQEEVQQQPGVDDIWLVLGCSTEHDGRISSRACYLYGIHQQQTAMLLQFAAGNQLLPPPLLSGQHYEGVLHFYPSATPLRVAGTEQLKLIEVSKLTSVANANSHSTLTELLAKYAEQLSANPFQNEMPMTLSHVSLTRDSNQDERWFLQSAGDEEIAIVSDFKQAWHLHALTAGERFTIFGIWNGSGLRPLTLLSAQALPSYDQIHSFDTE